MTDTRTPVQRIKDAIEKMPPSELVGVLVHVIRVCISKKAFGEKKLSEVVSNIESKL